MTACHVPPRTCVPVPLSKKSVYGEAPSMRTSAGVDVAIVVERVQQRVSFIHVGTVSELRRPRKTKSLHVLLAHTVFF